MILIFHLLKLIFKMVALIIIIAFERVVGVPILFITISVSMMLISKDFSKYILFIAAAFLLAVFYQLAFVLTFIIFTLFYILFVYGSNIIESNIQRFVLLLTAANLVIGYVSGVELGVPLLIQVIVSLLISLLFLIKFLFLKYGFLGSKIAIKHSFFK